MDKLPLAIRLIILPHAFIDSPVGPLLNPITLFDLVPDEASIDHTGLVLQDALAIRLGGVDLEFLVGLARIGILREVGGIEFLGLEFFEALYFLLVALLPSQAIFSIRFVAWVRALIAHILLLNLL